MEVSFGRTMIQALELLGAGKTHVPTLAFNPCNSVILGIKCPLEYL